MSLLNKHEKVLMKRYVFKEIGINSDEYIQNYKLPLLSVESPELEELLDESVEVGPVL